MVVCHDNLRVQVKIRPGDHFDPLMALPELYLTTWLGAVSKVESASGEKSKGTAGGGDRQ